MNEVPCLYIHLHAASQTPPVLVPFLQKYPRHLTLSHISVSHANLARLISPHSSTKCNPCDLASGILMLNSTFLIVMYSLFMTTLSISYTTPHPFSFTSFELLHTPEISNLLSYSTAIHTITLSISLSALLKFLKRAACGMYCSAS